MATAKTIRTATDLSAAILAGQLAGLAMMGILVAGTTINGTQVAFPLQAVAASFLGESALGEPTSYTLFAGAFAHQLGPALFWSLMFGVLATRLGLRKRPGTALLAGIALGGLALLVDVHLLLPLLTHALGGSAVWRERIPRGWDTIAHLVYGLSLGFFYADERARIDHGSAAQRPL